MFQTMTDGCSSDHLVNQLLGHLDEGIIILLPRGIPSGESNVKAYVKLNEGDSPLSTCLDKLLLELLRKRNERQAVDKALCQPNAG